MTGIVPIADPVSIIFGVSTRHCDECEGEEYEHENDLAAREPELGLSKDGHSYDIEKTT